MDAENDLKRVCAWCGKDMGTKPSAETGTTHGMCPDCLKKEMGEMENIKTSAEKRNEAAAEGARRWGSAKNADQIFISDKQMEEGPRSRKGDDVVFKGKEYVLSERDEYPQGNPGWWATMKVL
jgi:hypothetical protein